MLQNGALRYAAKRIAIDWKNENKNRIVFEIFCRSISIISDDSIRRIITTKARNGGNYKHKEEDSTRNDKGFL